MTMKIGDTVRYRPDPDLYGDGLYLEPDVSGLIRVLFTDGTTELFDEAELTHPDEIVLT